MSKFRWLFIKFPSRKSATGLYQRLGRLCERNARLEEDGAMKFDPQCKIAAVGEQVSVCAQEVETEQVSVHA